MDRNEFRILKSLHKSKQILYSVPAYFREVSRLEKPGDLYDWAYYKFPNLFPLAELPPYITIELTNQCNLSCRHCWRNTMTRQVGYMNTTLFEQIVQEVSLWKPKLFKIGGSGEPALHPRFDELMTRLTFAPLRVIVYTNGTLLRLFSHKDILSWKLDTIVVSVDGLDATSYEKIKLGSNYSEVRKLVSDFCDNRNSLHREWPDIEVRHIMMPHESARELLEFQRDWLRLADTVRFNNLEPANGLSDFEDISPPKCRSIRREIAIQWDGRVPLCGGYRNKYLGNVKDSSIAELWRHPLLEKLRRCNTRREFSDAPLCRRCCRCR